MKSAYFLTKKNILQLHFRNISSISPSGNQFIISGQLTIKETQVPLQLLTTITIEKQDPKTKEVASFILDATHILNRRNHDLAFYKK